MFAWAAGFQTLAAVAGLLTGGVVDVAGVPAGSSLVLRPEEWIPFLNCDFDSNECEWWLQQPADS